MVEDMPKNRLPYCLPERTRHGTLVWYFRRGHGPRLRLKGDYGSSDFLDSYHAALAGAPVQRTGKAARGTLRWLVEEWRKSGDYREIAQATRKQRDNILSRVLEKAGDGKLGLVTKESIKRARDKQADRRFAANNYLKTMRALFRWAKSEGHMAIDPASDVPFLSEETEGHPPWTEDDVAAYCKRWEEGTREWIAFQVLLNTGFRRGDAVIVGRPHVRDGVITLRTEKTGELVAIPILPELARALEIGPVGEMTFIATTRGRPMVKEHFGNWFRDSCRAAGIKKSAHGLRKLAATRFSEAGVSEDQLDAWFGWGTIGMSRKYTKAAKRKVHAQEAAKKLLASRQSPAPVLDSPAPKNMVNDFNDLAAPNRRVVGGEIE